MPDSWYEDGKLKNMKVCYSAYGTDNKLAKGVCVDITMKNLCLPSPTKWADGQDETLEIGVFLNGNDKTTSVKTWEEMLDAPNSKCTQSAEILSSTDGGTSLSEE